MRGRISPRDDPHQFMTMVLGKQDDYHLRLYRSVAKHESRQSKSWRSLTRRERIFLRIWAGTIPDRYPTRIVEISRIVGCTESNAWYGVHVGLQKLGLEVC